MYELLSLPRSPKIYMLKKKYARGLPINSLPGWEHIPLNRKLPMLKCPDNQVIFSKSKIGQNLLKSLKQEFSSSVREELPVYNSLHDPNLKPYYANKRNLVRLRENGEITRDNDVICTLKDFNKFRQELHKIHLYSAMKRFRRLEDEQRDRILIGRAEAIKQHDYENLDKKRFTQTDVIERKHLKEAERAEHFATLWKQKKEKLNFIENDKLMQRELNEHKKKLGELRIKAHIDLSLDYQRKHLIALKKYFQHKNDRFIKQQKAFEATLTEEQKRKALDFWHRRMELRIQHEKVMTTLLKEEEDRREFYIEEHRLKYQQKWQEIEKQIKVRSQKLRRQARRAMGIKRKRRKVSKTPKPNYIFDGVLDADLAKVLRISVDMSKIPFEPDDPLYKGAAFILEKIVAKFRDDLSCNEQLMESTKERLDRFFDQIREDVACRATQLIQSNLQGKTFDGAKVLPKIHKAQAHRLSVAFDYSTHNIGIASYNINPNVEIKRTSNRVPTPKVSLEEIKSVLRSNSDFSLYKENVHKDNDNQGPDVMLFVEFLMTKYKRELSIGIGKRVFKAVEDHYNHNKITPIRQELLELDKNFLVFDAARSLLSYAINPLNFQSNLKLCIRAFSTDVIYYLQKNLFKLNCDPRDLPEGPSQLIVRNSLDSLHTIKIFNSELQRSELECVPDCYSTM